MIFIIQFITVLMINKYLLLLLNINIMMVLLIQWLIIQDHRRPSRRPVPQRHVWHLRQPDGQERGLQGGEQPLFPLYQYGNLLKTKWKEEACTSYQQRFHLYIFSCDASLSHYFHIPFVHITVLPPVFPSHTCHDPHKYVLLKYLSLKVETVKDCFVTVAGAPKRIKDHAAKDWINEHYHNKVHFAVASLFTISSIGNHSW